jgi:hypothetical protein
MQPMGRRLSEFPCLRQVCHWLGWLAAQSEIIPLSLQEGQRLTTFGYSTTL